MGWHFQPSQKMQPLQKPFPELLVQHLSNILLYVFVKLKIILPSSAEKVKDFYYLTEKNYLRDAPRDTAWPRRRPRPPWRRSWPPRRGCRRRPGRPWRRPRAGPALQPGPCQRLASPRCFRPRSCVPRTTLISRKIRSWRLRLDNTKTAPCSSKLCP